MNRRQFLSAGASALACIGLPPRPARAHIRPQVMRFSCSNGISSQQGQYAVAFAAQVQALSGGRLRIEVYPSSSLGGEAETIADTSKGVLEMTLVSSAGYAAVAPRLGVFDIPFLFRDVAHARAVLDGPIGQQALSEVEAAGLVGLAWGENGLRHLTTATVPVTKPEDLAGLKVRVPQSEIMVKGLKALGADARPLSFPELYGALSSGEFQAQENPLSNILSSNFDRVQKYLSLTGHVYSPAMLVMSRRAYDGVPEEDRPLLHRAARIAARTSRDYGDQSEASATAELKRRGMTVLTDIDRQAFMTASLRTQGEFEALFGPATLAAIRAYGK
ncbi:TRAP transporter substrate-binding protein [Methylobacterium sp. ID0610]|uniref:TRAP transporter substrate-binding protein n=1 Tax=Methylobacterium carpenticola TaxID=3344827 RepID=UPI0036C6D813